MKNLIKMMIIGAAITFFVTTVYEVTINLNHNDDDSIVAHLGKVVLSFASLFTVGVLTPKIASFLDGYIWAKEIKNESEK